MPMQSPMQLNMKDSHIESSGDDVVEKSCGRVGEDSIVYRYNESRESLEENEGKQHLAVQLTPPQSSTEKYCQNLHSPRDLPIPLNQHHLATQPNTFSLSIDEESGSSKTLEEVEGKQYPATRLIIPSSTDKHCKNNQAPKALLISSNQQFSPTRQNTFSSYINKDSKSRQRHVLPNEAGDSTQGRVNTPNPDSDKKGESTHLNTPTPATAEEETTLQYFLRTMQESLEMETQELNKHNSEMSEVVETGIALLSGSNQRVLRSKTKLAQPGNNPSDLRSSASRILRPKSTNKTISKPSRKKTGNIPGAPSGGGRYADEDGNEVPGGNSYSDLQDQIGRQIKESGINPIGTKVKSTTTKRVPRGEGRVKLGGGDSLGKYCAGAMRA